MPLRVVVFDARPIDVILAHLFSRLMEDLGNNIVLVESIDGWDGSNVRIVVRRKTDDVIDRIFDCIEEVEKKYSSPGTIIPQIVDIDEFRMSNVVIVEDVSTLLNDLKSMLEKSLGDELVDISAVDGWDGSNVRIVVRRKTDDVIDRIFDCIEEVEKKYSSPGTIIPQIVGQNEV